MPRHPSGGVARGWRAPAADVPRMFRAWLRYGWTEDPSEAWLARDDDGEVCGWYLLSLPERENRHLADLSLVVAPSRRRAGLGTALLGHAADRARQAGRTLLTGHSRRVLRRDGLRPLTGCPAPAHRDLLGAPARLHPSGSPGRPARKAAAAAAGYSLVSWEGADRGTPAGSRSPNCSGSGRRAARRRGGAAGLGRRPGPGGRPAASRSGVAVLQPRRPGGAQRARWWRSPSSGWTRSTRAGVSSR